MIKKRGSKRGQMKLSYGMIFSIILIIVFLAFAFYAIKKFMGIQNTVMVGDFIDSLGSDVDKMWKGSQGSQEREYRLPKKIQYVCFADFYSSERGGKDEYYPELKRVFNEKENLVFYPVGSGGEFDSVEVKHIDIEAMTENNNPYCIENKDGKVNMIIKKNHGEALVTVSD